MAAGLQQLARVAEGKPASGKAAPSAAPGAQSFLSALDHALAAQPKAGRAARERTPRADSGAIAVAAAPVQQPDKPRAAEHKADGGREARHDGAKLARTATAKESAPAHPAGQQARVQVGSRQQPVAQQPAAQPAAAQQAAAQQAAAQQPAAHTGAAAQAATTAQDKLAAPKDAAQTVAATPALALAAQRAAAPAQKVAPPQATAEAGARADASAKSSRAQAVETDGKPVSKARPNEREANPSSNADHVRTQGAAAETASRTPSVTPAAAAAAAAGAEARILPADHAGQGDTGAGALQAWRRYDVEAGTAYRDQVSTLAGRTAGEMSAEIIRQSQFIRQNGNTTIQLQLNPPEMGRIKLEVVQTRSGELEVHLRVENPDVREAMTRELAGLDRTLRDAQVDVQHFEVTDYQTGRQAGGRDAAADGGPSGQGGEAVRTPGDDDSGQAGWARISESGSVDCLV